MGEDHLLAHVAAFLGGSRSIVHTSQAVPGGAVMASFVVQPVWGGLYATLRWPFFMRG
jgi:hypothetical protein